MSRPTLADLAPLAPELVLVGTALALLLLARRIQAGPFAAGATLAAALGAGVVAALAIPAGPASGFGGMIVADDYARFFKVLIAATLGLAVLLTTGGARGDDSPRAEYHVLLLLAATGMMLAASAADLLPLYLALELTTLCSFVLVGIRVDHAASNEAAIKYFLLGSFASAVLLFGISLSYAAAGTTELAGIAAALAGQELENPVLLWFAVGLVAAGLSFKIAAVPFHAWAPDAYQGAATPVAGYLAGGAKAAGLAALGRVCVVAFDPAAEVVAAILVVLAALSILTGSIVALAQSDMKRLLAYSSIAHAGYALLGLTAGTPDGASATMTYAFLYVFMTLGTFGVVVALGERGESVGGYRGLAAQRPGTAALMLLFLLSLTGIPPTAGFVAKFAVISSAIGAGQVPLAVLAVACSVVTAFVYLRIAVFMYMTEASEPAPARPPLGVSAALVIAALVTLAGGVVPRTLTAWAVAP